LVARGSIDSLMKKPVCRTMSRINLRSPYLRPQPQDVPWTIRGITGTPAKYVGRVFAPDEQTAIAKAIQEYGLKNPHQSATASGAARGPRRSFVLAHRSGRGYISLMLCVSVLALQALSSRACRRQARSCPSMAHGCTRSRSMGIGCWRAAILQACGCSHATRAIGPPAFRSLRLRLQDCPVRVA
jgi:hypothetical protein